MIPLQLRRPLRRLGASVPRTLSYYSSAPGPGSSVLGASTLPSRAASAGPSIPPRLHLLETEATRFPHDAERQAAFYAEALRAGVDPRVVTSRFERAGRYARNEECVRHYAEALARDGRAAHVYDKMRDLLASSSSSPLTSTTTPLLQNTSTASPNGAQKNSLFSVFQSQARQQQQQDQHEQPAGTRQAPIHVIVDQMASQFTRGSAAQDLFRWFLSLSRGLIVGFFFLTVFQMISESSGLSKLSGQSQRSGDVKPTIFSDPKPPNAIQKKPTDQGKKPSSSSQNDPQEVKAVPSSSSAVSTSTESARVKTEPRVRFADVAGVDEAKSELQELVDFLKDPENFNRLGGRMPKGVLLTGPPGTGKTLLAKAVAGEAGVPFYFMSGSEFEEVFVGVGARRLRELFAAARANAPSIVFIDEIDAIGSSRNPRDPAFARQTLNQLLVDLDGFGSNDGVIFMAATNFPGLLDRALLRPGRFDKHVAVPLPDMRGRADILNVHLKKVAADPTLNVNVIARGTVRFSGADLANLINQAAILASREKSSNVTAQHIEAAKDRIIMGAARRLAQSPEAKRLTAYHEAGHALVALRTPGAMPLHKVTIVPRGHSLGATTMLPGESADYQPPSLREAVAQIDVSMGGRAAERLVVGLENATAGVTSDLQKATSIARRMIQEYGMCDTVGPMAVPTDASRYGAMSEATRGLIERETRRILDESHERVNKLLVKHRDELERLATALLEHETLNADEADKAARGVPIAPKPN